MRKTSAVIWFAALTAATNVGIGGEPTYPPYKVDPAVGNATVRRSSLDIVTFKRPQEFLKAIEVFAPKLGSHVYLFLGRDDEYYYAATQLGDPPSLIRVERNAVTEQEIIAALSRIKQVEAEWESRTAVVKPWPEAYMFMVGMKLDKSFLPATAHAAEGSDAPD